MDMMDTQHLQLAAYNNAVWCDTVCRSHNVPGEFHDTVWVNRHQTPIYYPNLVTLASTANLTTGQHDQSVLTEFLTVKRGYTISLKDSFAVLDLTPFGFHQLFEAQWIFRQAATTSSQRGTTEVQWKRITEEKELLQWEEAWSQTDAHLNRLFLPALLDDTDVCIIATYKDNRIVAGAIANLTREVVGLSNLFTPSQGAEAYWQGALNVIADLYPGHAIVGYEQGESLTRALHAGFRTLGPLRVWLKEG